MATKTQFSNYENLFSAYRESISNRNSSDNTNYQSQIDTIKSTLTSIESEIKQLNGELSNPKKKVPIIDTRKSTQFAQKFSEQLKKAQAELDNAKINNVVFSDNSRKSLEASIKFEEKRLDKTKTEINSLTNSIIDPATPASSIPSLKAKRTKATKLQKSIEDSLNKYLSQLAEDNEKLAKIEKAQANYDSVQNQYNAILLDEKEYARKIAPALNSQIQQEIEDKKLKRRQLLVTKNRLSKELSKLQKNLENVPTTTKGDIETFKKFLTDNGFSTVHAEELYTLYNNPKTKLTLAQDEFKLRKQHPKRDRFIKKLAIPVAATSGVVGIASGAIAASNLIAGSKWAFITITSNPAVNFLSAALPGAAIGAFAAYSTIKLKDYFTKVYYNAKYGNAEKALNEPDSAKLFELIEKIENTKDDILDLRTGRNNIFSRFGRAIKRTGKNIVNRNRIHHVEAITEKLVEKFNAISENNELSVEVKLRNTTPIYELLSKINSFYARDIQKSKIFAMLNCKETDKNHSHKETIENLDIYSKLTMYLERVGNNAELSKSSKKKAHKAIKADLKKQNIVAERLLNGEQVTGLVAKRYLELVKVSDKNHTPKSKTISSYIVVDGDLKVTFADEKSTTYQVENAQNILKVESVNLGKTLLITYKNGEQASIPSTAVKQKINLNMAGEYKVFDTLQKVAVIDYLVEQKGINKDIIFTFIDDLKLTKFNKNGKEKAKPSAFMKSKAYKENSEYTKIMEEVAAIIKNPNIINIDYGFNK